MTNANSSTITNPQVGWCRSHEGIHARKADCADYRHSTELIGCDAHGKKPHRQSESCVSPSKDKADPFYGF